MPGAVMADGTGRLSKAAVALLEQRLARRGGEARTPIIPRLPSREAPPMSYAQWRLWFLEQLRPGTNAWNSPVVVRLDGRLEVEALCRALAHVVDRQHTLRTIFPAARGRPTPVLVEDPLVELPLIRAEEPGVAQGLIEQEVRRGFDLGADPMVRARLLALGPERHVLVLVAHHIACDGWSKGLLLGELSGAYDAFLDGRRPSLTELPICYGDYAAWQRASLSGEHLDGLTRFWTEALSGHSSFAELPSDLPRPAVQGFRGATVPMSVPRALARTAVALGRRHRATPFMTLMSAFTALLHAHTGQEDLLVGSPSAMRAQPEVEHLIGLFANTLVYRTNLGGHPTFAELIARVRQTALGVYRHQELPFEKIVEAVKPRRDASRNPLVQVNMRVEGPEPELNLRGLRSEPIAIDPGIARFDLAIELSAIDDGYAGYLEYDNSLFQPATAALLARQFVAVLDAAVAAPDVPLAKLDPIRDIRGGVGP